MVVWFKAENESNTHKMAVKNAGIPLRVKLNLVVGFVECNNFFTH